MRTPASIARHPVHPILIVFPLGLFLTATLFDIVTLVEGGTALRLTAYYMIVAGVIDYFYLRGAAGRTATWHMVTNLVVMAFFIASALLRTRWGQQWIPAGS